MEEQRQRTSSSMETGIVDGVAVGGYFVTAGVLENVAQQAFRVSRFAKCLAGLNVAVELLNTY